MGIIEDMEVHLASLETKVNRILTKVRRIETKLNVGDADDLEPDSGDPDSVDEFPSPLKWLHADVSKWKVTSKMEVVQTPKALGKGIIVKHSMRGSWPVIGIGPDTVAVEANPWIIVRIDRVWYAATWEWLRPGQSSKNGIGAANIGEHIKKDPLEEWVPKLGERIGFFVSTPARDHRRTSNERSNVILTRWGENWSADA